MRTSGSQEICCFFPLTLSTPLSSPSRSRLYEKSTEVGFTPQVPLFGVSRALGGENDRFISGGFCPESSINEKENESPIT